MRGYTIAGLGLLLGLTGGCAAEDVADPSAAQPAEAAVAASPATQPAASAPARGVSAATQDVLQGVTYVDMYAPGYLTQRPLLCGQGRHYPEGTEMVFRSPDTGAESHVVFPKGVAAPRDGELTKALTLHGRFKTIQTTPDSEARQKPHRPSKRVLDGYRYFVVSRWEIRNSPAR